VECDYLLHSVVTVCSEHNAACCCDNENPDREQKRIKKVLCMTHYIVTW
jgi:hypothetical protein